MTTNPAPTETQMAVLRGIHRHCDPFRGACGMSEHGGRGRSLDSTIRRGWVRWEHEGNQFVLTSLGHSVMEGGVS